MAVNYGSIPAGIGWFCVCLISSHGQALRVKIKVLCHFALKYSWNE